MGSTQPPAPTPPAAARPRARRPRAALFGLLIGVVAVGATVGAAVMATRNADGTSTRAQTMLRMQYYNRTLGVDCTYCHVPGKFTIETPRMRTTKWMEEHLVGALVERKTHKQIDCHTCPDGRTRFLPSSH